jgi:hypothetical protein
MLNIETTKSLLAIFVVLSVVIGYFFGSVNSEIFYTTVGSVIAHFYQGSKIKELNQKIEQQSIKIQSLTDA